MGLPPSERDPAALRELADSILRDARYDVAPESIPDRVLGWLGDQIGKALATLVGSGGGTAIAWLILLGALGATVYLLVRYGRVTIPPLERGPASEVMVELTRSAAEWRADAERLEAEGRWEEGLRARHRALVADLVHRGVIPERAGRTAGEHVRDVAGTWPDAGPAMAAATELFEAAWYGGATTGPDEAARFAALTDDVLAVRA